MIESVIGTWIDIIVITIILFFLIRFYKKRKIKIEEEKRKRSMTPAEFSTWLEEEKRQSEEKEKQKIQEKMELVDKLNNKHEYKSIFNKLCMQNNNSIIVYLKFFFEKESKKVCIAYRNYQTAEGYYSYLSLTDIDLDKLSKDRQRFLQFKKEIEIFGFEIQEREKP